MSIHPADCHISVLLWQQVKCCLSSWCSCNTETGQIHCWQSKQCFMREKCDFELDPPVNWKPVKSITKCRRNINSLYQCTSYSKKNKNLRTPNPCIFERDPKTPIKTNWCSPTGARISNPLAIEILNLEFTSTIIAHPTNFNNNPKWNNWISGTIAHCQNDVISD